MRTLRLTSLCAVILLIVGSSVNAQTGIGVQTTTVAPITTAPQTGPNSQISAEEATGASGAVKTPPALAASKAGVSKTEPSTKSIVPQTGPTQATATRPLPATTAPDGKAAPAAKAAASALMTAAMRTKEGHEALAKTQEAEIARATAKLAELRQLVAEGLIARVELENAEHLLAGLRSNLETLRKNAADSERTMAELRKAEELAKVKPLLPAAKNASTRSFLKPVILRYGGQAGWSLGRLSMVQTFFASTFGQTLPVSALGQSATHNRLGYNHRNSVDVALHPDSAQGKALISYLESQGIPYLAFRTAVVGVATGPHIHIGYPSNRV